MLVSTCGIVLYQADYSETSLIVKIFTEHYGLQSYIVKGVRKKGSRIKRNLFGPLSMVDLVAYYKENAGMHIIRDVSCHRQFNQIAGDIRKSSVLLFMNELLYRSIHGEMTDQRMFGFISDWLVQLEETTTDTAFFPLQFAVKLLELLGIMPHNNYSEYDNIFDLQEGHFSAHIPDHNYYILPPLSLALAELLNSDESDKNKPDHATRVFLLEKMLDYYRLHFPSFGTMNSHHVLSIVLRD
jgi:DNA repair protein RecO (recombination protein O)